MAATGFGTVTMDLGRALLDKGQDVRFMSQNAIDGMIEPFASRTLDVTTLIQKQESAILQGHNEAVVEGFAKVIPGLVLGTEEDQFAISGVAWGDWRPDAVILLGDFAAVRRIFARYDDAFRRVPSYHYVPVEGVDLPPLWKDVWDTLKPVAMSQFGVQEIARIVGYDPPLVYHGVDTDVYHPVSPRNPIMLRDGEATWKRIESKADAKKAYGFDPRLKWVLRTDSHWPRKNQNALIRAMVPVLRDRPDTLLMLHNSVEGPGGFLPDTVSKYPQVEPQIRFHGRKVSRDEMAVLYNAADVYVSTSAEGFGLTIAEAIACGVPAVGLEYSAVPEVIGPAGAVVPIDTITDNEYDHFWARPNEPEFTKAVSWMLDHPKKARELGAKGPAHVREHFQWGKAADEFLKVLGADSTIVDN